MGSQEEYESTVETLHLLRSPANAARLRRSIEAANAGTLAEHALSDEPANAYAANPSGSYSLNSSPR